MSTPSIAHRQADRSLADRHAGYVAEIERIIDATYRVIERTGNVDPTMREILREAQLSTPAFYRHFASKDELFVVLLDDGRRRLASAIERRLRRETTGEGKLRAWVTTVLAQARDASVASRTRPFVTRVDRLVERYPLEHRASEQLLCDQLADVLAGSPEFAGVDPQADANAIYQLVFGVLGWHLRNRSTPVQADIDHLVDFARRALSNATTATTSATTTAAAATTGRQEGEHHG